MRESVDVRLLWWNTSWQHNARLDAQVDAVLGLSPRPDVVALGELDAGRAARWRGTLAREGFTTIRAAPGLNPRDLRVLLAAGIPIVRGRQLGDAALRPRAVRSARVLAGERQIDVHAVHVPNGSTNGWLKIDHLEALRRHFDLPHLRPQVLCGDFNTPRLEEGRPPRVITFGQDLRGRPRRRPTSPQVFTPNRPFDPAAWDAGERAVLEGLPDECGMPDVFRVAHPQAIEATWVPRGAPEVRGRRLDHAFASAELAVRSCRHIHKWRTSGLSDHSALEVVLAVPQG